MAERSSSRFVVGLILLLGVVFEWVASLFITSNLETSEDGWNKPFLITYLNTSSFALYLIPSIIRYRRRREGIEKEDDSQLYQPLSQGNELVVPNSSRRSTSLTRSILSLTPHTPLLHTDGTLDLSPLTIRETAEVAAWWSAVWFIANWAGNAALAWTSVASVTILSSTSGFFTLALGTVFGVESATRTKLFAVIASFLGVLLVTHSDSTISPSEQANLPTHPVLGDCLALLSASFYAVYVILLKVRIGDEGRADMQLMLGFAGLFNIICLIPAFPLLHYSGWETFELPPNRKAWIICLINMFITVSSDYLYVLAMLKTTAMREWISSRACKPVGLRVRFDKEQCEAEGPEIYSSTSLSNQSNTVKSLTSLRIVVTVGVSLTIPLALIGSAILPGSDLATVTVTSLFGAGLVILGFCLLGWQGWGEAKMGVSNEERSLDQDRRIDPGIGDLEQE